MSPLSGGGGSTQGLAPALLPPSASVPTGPSLEANPTSAKASASGIVRKRGASATPDGSSDKRSRPDDGRPMGMGSPNNSRGDKGHSDRLWGEEATKLDVYVWDYLTRRGFNAAAKTLVSEAQMNEPPDVPLKTPQGLLFEYWAIFWDVFAARSGRGTVDARTYLDFEDARQSQLQNDSNRRSDTTETNAAGAGGGPSGEGSRFPSMVVGNGSSAQADGMSGAAAAAVAAHQRTAGNLYNNGAAPGTVQAQGPSVILANLPQQQQQQILVQVARQRGIPLEEIRQYSPAMRQALVNSAVQQSQQQQQQQNQQQQLQQQQQQQQIHQGQPIIIAPGGPGGQSVRIAPGHPQYEQAFQNRLAQQRAIQGQLVNRPSSQGPQSAGPQGAVAGQSAVNRASMLPPGATGSPASTMQVPTPAAGPVQVGTPGSGGGPDVGRQSAGPQLQQQQQQQQQQSQQQATGSFTGVSGPQQQPTTPGGGPGTLWPEPPPQAMLPEHLRKKPLLNPAQHAALISQFQQLQENIRQEGSKAQFAPNQMMAQQFMSNVSSLQAKAQHLQEILKAQPGLQAAAAHYSQQQAQARATGGLPGSSGGLGSAGQMNPPSSTPMMQAGMLTPQQRAQFAAQQQHQQGMGSVNGQLPVGQSGQQRVPTGDQQSLVGIHLGPGQPHPQQQQTPQQMAGNNAQQGGPGGDYSTVDQQRSNPAVHFTGNPFGRQGGGQILGQPSQQQGPQQFGMNRPAVEDQSQHPLQQLGALGGNGLGRPNITRTASAMGANTSVSSPSPRNPSVNNGMQGPNGKAPLSASSPAAMVPNTPKQVAAEPKKKKEPKARKNSKAIKTPQLGHTSTPSSNGVEAATPSAGQGGIGGGLVAPQTPTSNQPTPRMDHQQVGKGLQRPQSRSGNGSGGGDGQESVNGTTGHSLDTQQPTPASNAPSASMTNFETFGAPLDGLGVSGAGGIGGNSVRNVDTSGNTGGMDTSLMNEDFSSLFASNDYFDFDAGGTSSAGGPNGGNGGTGNFDWDISSLSGMFGNEIGGGS